MLDETPGANPVDIARQRRATSTHMLKDVVIIDDTARSLGHCSKSSWTSCPTSKAAVRPHEILLVVGLHDRSRCGNYSANI
ncbi:MAG: hypothetical protein ACLUPK_01815 [Veillonella sp.]